MKACLLGVLLLLVFSRVVEAQESQPSVPACGNGILEVGEDCEDGNLAEGDGCPSDCIRKPTPLPANELELSQPEETPGHFIFSALGPGSGSGAFGVGARLLYSNRDFLSGRPGLGLAYAHGLTQRLTLRALLEANDFVGVVTDVSVGYRAFYARGFALSLGVGALGLFSQALLGGVGGGAILSFGGENVQLSANLNTRYGILYSLPEGFQSAFLLNSSGTLEFKASKKMKIYLQGHSTFPLNTRTIAVGLSR
jgi:cysteine-rich repeat protein